MTSSNHVSIVEVGPRDGLQNVKNFITTAQKKALLQYLLEKGFADIEAGSFVRPDRVPSMADTAEIAQNFHTDHDRLWYLAPNLRGVQSALQAGVSQIAFFTASSETFNEKNIGMSVAKSIATIQEAVTALKSQGYSFVPRWNQKPRKEKELKLRLYVSTVIACPYDGKMKSSATAKIVDTLLPLGFSQVSLGDTIGVGVPSDWDSLLSSLDPRLISDNRIALHCHDTYSTALACIYKGLEKGVRTFDSSIGGLGGCPFAPGAAGNLATEDLLYFLEKEGMETGLSARDLLDTFSKERTGELPNLSKVHKALSSPKTTC